MKDTEFQKLLDSDEPVIFYLSQLKIITLFFLLLCALFLLQQRESKIDQFIFWVVFLAEIWVCAAIIFRKAHALVITPEHFSNNGLFFSEQFYWKDVSEFESLHLKNWFITGRWNLFPYVFFSDYDKTDDTTLQAIKRFLGMQWLRWTSRDYYIQNMYPIKTKQLIELMNNKRRKARKAIGRDD